MKQPRRGHYRGTYVGFNLRITSDVARSRDRICDHYGLVPRLECHVTLGYIRSMSHADLQNIAKRLRGAAERLPSAVSFDVAGTGGVYRFGDGTLQPLEDNGAEHSKCPRVVWWAITTSSWLESLRILVQSAITDTGVDAADMDNEYQPHVTLGSAGPEGDPGDWSGWDVHGVRKGVTLTILSCPSRLDVERLHLTNAHTHPASLLSLRTWRSA